MKRKVIISLAALFACFILGFYMLDNGSFISPIRYQEDILIRSDGRGNGYFGSGRNGRRIHQGADLLADIGTAVLASRAGIVVAAKSNRGMGNYIIIKHLGGLTTVYGHLLKSYVVQGQFVWKGQIIGCVGKTGNANSRAILAHLHFELRKDGIPQDPLEYLR